MPVIIPAAAGKPYRPSNGTEGDLFYAQYCARCRAEEDDDNPCMIYGNALFNNIGDPDYPIEWKFDANGHPKCSAFVWRGPDPTRLAKSEGSNS